MNMNRRIPEKKDPEFIRKILNELRITNGDAIKLLVVPPETFYGWLSGNRKMPAIARTAFKMLQFISENGLGKHWLAKLISPKDDLK